MKSLPAKTLVLLVAVAFALPGCEKAKEANPPSSPPQTETLKPDRVGVNRVALLAFSELAHLERALKPFFGTEIAADSTRDCRVRKFSRASLWTTDWNCDLRDATPGRKEIVGHENLDFEAGKAVLTYDSRFETRLFDGDEPTDQAHSVLNTRKMKVIFDKTSGAPESARFTISSRALRMNATRLRRGSNWTMSISGRLRLIDDEWFVEPSSRIVIKGAIFGDDSERFTMWASGDFTFTSETETRLSGISSPTTCAKTDAGKWTIKSVGGGESFDTEIELSAAGVSESSGSALKWPYDRCDRP